MNDLDNAYFFCGIGGSGMSALAQLAKARGFAVKGSDRGFDNGNNQTLIKKLQSQGIELFSQDGSGLSENDILVVSTAVEDTIPDVKAAKALNCQILHRSQLLADFFNLSKGVAVGGTSGKSSVTAMVGHILTECGVDPTVVNGAVMPQFNSDKMHGNVRCGDSDVMVIEADESDGSIVNYRPFIGILNNISKDHKTLEELNLLFTTFVENCQYVVYNINCPEVAKVPLNGNLLSYGIENVEADFNAENLKRTVQGVEFQINKLTVKLPVLGAHNVENALSAMAAASLLGVKVEDSANAMASYAGIERRMQLVGEVDHIRVIDDFAHNPDKIRAVIQALKTDENRLIVFWQPHGFGPVKFLKNEFIDSFVKNTNENDLIIMPEIYYAGGSADKSVSAKDLIDEIEKTGRNAYFVLNREDVPNFIKSEAKAGDTVLLLGARDVTLAAFAKDVYDCLRGI